VTPEFRWTIHRLDAYEEGSVGWAAADTTVAYGNGMMAQSQLTRQDLDFAAHQLNGRPRQTLGWMTPSQKLAEASQ
jgi:hypothetical protein